MLYSTADWSQSKRSECLLTTSDIAVVDPLVSDNMGSLVVDWIDTGSSKVEEE